MAESGRITQLGLRNLRLRLTLLYTIMSAIGLGTLGAVLLVSDARGRFDGLDAELRLQATQGVRSVWYDEQQELQANGVKDDDSLAGGYPQVYLVERTGQAEDGTPTVSVLVEPRTPYYRDASIDRIATDAIGVGAEQLRRERLGGTYPVRLLAKPVLNNEGKPGAAIVSIADESTILSDQRTFRVRVVGGSLALLLLSALGGYFLAGRSLRPAVSALLQHERFLADAAHEIRTPIAAIRALAEGAAAGDQPQEEALERTAEIAAHAGRTVDDLLLLARADAGRLEVRREPLRLDLLVEELAEDVPGATVRAAPVVVEGDASLLRRAVANLLANAVRHGRALDPNVPIELTVEQGRVVVEDQGPGVEPGMDDRLFERFQSGRRGGGTGLGLPLAQLIAELHGGEITIAPRDGGGTRATLRIGTSARAEAEPARGTPAGRA